MKKIIMSLTLIILFLGSAPTIGMEQIDVADNEIFFLTKPEVDSLIPIFAKSCTKSDFDDLQMNGKVSYYLQQKIKNHAPLIYDQLFQPTQIIYLWPLPLIKLYQQHLLTIMYFALPEEVKKDVEKPILTTLCAELTKLRHIKLASLYRHLIAKDTFGSIPLELVKKLETKAPTAYAFFIIPKEDSQSITDGSQDSYYVKPSELQSLLNIIYQALPEELYHTQGRALYLAHYYDLTFPEQIRQYTTKFSSKIRLSHDSLESQSSIGLGTFSMPGSTESLELISWTQNIMRYRKHSLVVIVPAIIATAYYFGYPKLKQWFSPTKQKENNYIHANEQ